MSESIITVKGLSVRYERRTVLSNIYLEIEKGCNYAIIGPNGAGKSTFFKALLGLSDNTEGRVEVFGGPISRSRILTAYLPQKDYFELDFPATVYDIVLMGRYPHKTLFQRIDQTDREKVDSALRDMEIDHLADRQIGQLSGGQQQRVFIARALAQEAEIFFMDEPFAGVDITTEEKIVSIMHKLSKQGKTFLLVHHDLSTVGQYFDRVIMINQRLIAFGDVKSVFNQKNMSECFGAQLSVLHKLSHY